MDRVIPEMVPLHRVAKELDKATHVLVSASRSGTFCPIVKVGAVWFVRRDELDSWFGRQHAVSPEPGAMSRRLAAVADAQQPPAQPAQTRGRSASSSR